jgi:protein-tyrosine-phosphatase
VVVLAVLALSWPTLKALATGVRAQATGELLLFVCGGNTSRSPMAAAIAQAMLPAADGQQPPWQVGSAGLSVPSAGAPLSPQAATALRELGVPVPSHHRARPLTPRLCADSAAIYCMTRAQRDAVIAMAPQAADRTVCLDATADVPDPAGQPLERYRACATRLQELVRARLAERRQRHALRLAVEGEQTGPPPLPA